MNPVITDKASGATIVQQERIGELIKNQTDSLDDYLLGLKLGDGTQADVRVAQFLQDKSIRAIQIFKEELRNSYHSQVKSITQIGAHQNLVKFYSFFNEVKPHDEEFKADQKVNAIVMQYCGEGDVNSFLKRHMLLSQELCLYFFRQLISALKHIHSKGYCFRDISDRNIMFDGRFNIKFIDFGCAVKMQNKLFHHYSGSPDFLPQEMWSGREGRYDGQLVDIFAIGVVLLMMRFGQYPFLSSNGHGRNLRRSEDYARLISKNQEDNQTFWSQISTHHPHDWYSPAFKDLIQQLLMDNTFNRMNRSEVQKHPWFKGYRDMDMKESFIINMQKYDSVEGFLEQQLASYSDLNSIKQLKLNKMNSDPGTKQKTELMEDLIFELKKQNSIVSENSSISQSKKKLKNVFVQTRNDFSIVNDDPDEVFEFIADSKVFEKFFIDSNQYILQGIWTTQVQQIPLTIEIELLTGSPQQITLYFRKINTNQDNYLEYWEDIYDFFQHKIHEIQNLISEKFIVSLA